MDEPETPDPTTEPRTCEKCGEYPADPYSPICWRCSFR